MRSGFSFSSVLAANHACQSSHCLVVPRDKTAKPLHKHFEACFGVERCNSTAAHECASFVASIKSHISSSALFSHDHGNGHHHPKVDKCLYIVHQPRSHLPELCGLKLWSNTSFIQVLRCRWHFSSCKGPPRIGHALVSIAKEFQGEIGETRPHRQCM